MLTSTPAKKIRTLPTFQLLLIEDYLADPDTLADTRMI